MLEFYEAFATHEDLMTLTEDMLHGLCTTLHGSPILDYGEEKISFENHFVGFLYEGLTEYAGIPADKVSDRNAPQMLQANRRSSVGLQMEVSEASAEALIQPTFVTDSLDVTVFPGDADPTLVDRFELYIAGRELYAFSELNDPDDQRSRFEAQVEQRETGYTRIQWTKITFAHSSTAPRPRAKVRIDRLTMLMTNKQSIRDVIFPTHATGGLKPRWLSLRKLSWLEIFTRGRIRPRLLYVGAAILIGGGCLFRSAAASSGESLSVFGNAQTTPRLLMRWTGPNGSRWQRPFGALYVHDNLQRIQHLYGHHWRG